MERCMRCFRPYGNGRECLCRLVKEIDTGVKFVFLMHPKERRHERTGTGQLAHISLAGSAMFVGLEFAQCAPFMRLLHDVAYYSVLLYPADSAHSAMTAKSPDLLAALSVGGIDSSASPSKSTAASSEGGERGEQSGQADTSCSTQKTLFCRPLHSNRQRALSLLVIILDATWFCSRKIIEHNPFLLELPRLSFYGSYRTEYRFKREPRPECISTIESCYYLIKELQQTGLVNPACDVEPLMTVFRRMVQDQIDAQNERIAGLRPNTHAYDWKYTVPVTP